LGLASCGARLANLNVPEFLMVNKLLACGVSALFAVVIACADKPGSPVSPSAVTSLGGNVGPGGTTLKANAPTPVSPTGGARVEEVLAPTLIVSNAQAEFDPAAPLSYHFQLFDAAGALVHEATVGPGSGSTSYTVPFDLETNRAYSWRARAVLDTTFGPWSAIATFLSAEVSEGYIRGNELYDPLINGRTIGKINGPVTFIPGLGVRLETQLSYISYELQQTLTEGEFSIIVTGMPANTEGDKTKLFAMAHGYSDIVTNDRRMTIEKRGDPAGIIAWRFITHDDQVDTEGADRRFYNFLESETYFWEATWRSNVFRLRIFEGGSNGMAREIYNMGKGFHGRAYDPNPHVIYIGAPVGRSGVPGASVDRAIIRQVWVSSRPRPAFANR